jgi:hypothetical protein
MVGIRAFVYATSLTLERHAKIHDGALILGRTAPHRGFRTAVIADRRKPDRLLRNKLRAAFIDGAMGVQMALVSPCDGIAAERSRHNPGQQNDASGPRASNDVGHIRPP